jgi:hypothetical protein
MILPRSIRMTPSRRAPKGASEDPGGGSIAACNRNRVRNDGTAVYGFSALYLSWFASIASL